MTVTDASIDDIGRSIGAVGPGQPSSVGSLPAMYFPNPTGSTSPGTLVWQPAPGVIAELSVVVASSTGQVPPEVLAQLVAVGLVEVDDAAWQQLIDPAPSAPRIGLVGGAGHGEIGSYVPAGDASGGTADAGARHARLRSRRVPADGLDFAGTRTPSMRSDDPDHVDVRGTAGLMGDTPGYLSKVYGYDPLAELGRGRRPLPPRLHGRRHARPTR